MIIKAFYDEDDYKVVLKLLNGMRVPNEVMEADRKIRGGFR